MIKRILRILAFPVGLIGLPIWVIIWIFTGKMIFNYFMNFAVFGDWEDDV